MPTPTSPPLRDNFNMTTREGPLTSDGLEEHSGHVVATESAVDMPLQLGRVLTQINWGNTTALMFALQRKFKVVFAFNSTLIDNTFFESSAPPYGDLMRVSGMVLCAAGSLEEIFLALVQILYATRDLEEGEVSEDCAILIKIVEADQTNIQVQYKFSGKWLYASVLQDNSTDPMILIGTDR